MSLVSTYVEAVDGRFYQDPVLSGEDWFLCFDDDDPPELVIKADKKSDAELRARAEEILRSLQIQYQMISRKPNWAGRLFDDKGWSTEEAGAFFLRLRSPIPIPQESESSLSPEEFQSKKRQCVLYQFRKGKS